MCSGNVGVWGCKVPSRGHRVLPGKAGQGQQSRGPRWDARRGELEGQLGGDPGLRGVRRKQGKNVACGRQMGFYYLSSWSLRESQRKSSRREATG